MTNDEIINLFPFFKQTIAKKFHHETEQNNFEEIGKKPFNAKIYITVNYKGYPRFEKVHLPKISKLHDFDKIMLNRRSDREFSRNPITIKQLSTILYYSAGIRPNGKDITGNRFYPSAGARYPIEIYPIVFNCQGINPGIYHYHVRSHSLEFLWTHPNLNERVMNNIKQQEFAKSSCMFVITAVTSRTELKYGPRGYRHILMEIGHVCQNLYLTSSGLTIGACSIGGYLDSGFNDLLDLDGYIEKTLLVVAIGKLKGGD